MKYMRYLVLLLAVCLLLTGCRRDRQDGTDGSTSITEQQPAPELLNFSYGRLHIRDRFLRMNSNGMDFTLNFEKKIFTPNDDIVLTLYAANYTEMPLLFSLQTPVVSRQQLIHASLTYGANGEYIVPVTVEYTTESDLVGGAFDIELANRKMIATKITFHTSAYENIEQSIFHNDFSGTYRMSFWIGEEEYDYRIEPTVSFGEVEWNDPTQLQALILPEQYEAVVNDLRFTLSFAQTLHGTDDDIRLHVRIENVGREPLELYSVTDISDPLYYIRAMLSYDENTSVRDNVAGASEIMKIESRYSLKPQAIIERDITFYSSEFQNIQRSVYNVTCRDLCSLKVWVTVGENRCGLEIPLSYADYVPYSYHDREVPEITTVLPETTAQGADPVSADEPIE